ncbi:MAG: hypothetical protein ABIH85_04670 [Candidatus Omnitrophota bacterium]|nr:hypothetical protein [Candidatus Omnitrophota bacterium]
MRYRTVIELICNAEDKDEACNMAGEYLKGDIDFGVQMKFKTVSLLGHKVKRCVLNCTAVCFVVLAGITLFAPDVNNSESAKNLLYTKLRNTCTVMPALKTQHTFDFKRDWKKKKDEAVMEYIKN